MKYSPLFWPVQLKGRTIRVLDETELPQRLTYLEVKNLEQACAAIRTMKTRAVGQVLLIFYTFLLHLRNTKEKSSLVPTLTRMADRINATRPTMAFRVLTDLVLNWAREGEDVAEKILQFLEMLKQKRIEQAEAAASLLSDGDVILSHCNVSGLLPLIGELGRTQKKHLSFYVTETRPYFQGSRLTAWELSRAKFPVTVIPDSAVAYVLSRGLIDKVITGADQRAQNGDVANKIGTYQIALLAKTFKIPFYVLVPPPSFARTGDDITVEIRPERELLMLGGRRLAPKKAQGYYPAFDVTPAALITKSIPLTLPLWKKKS
jgi:methylthioribose-1-phosphate isomerase